MPGRTSSKGAVGWRHHRHPLEWHKPMIVGSLEAGIKYVATEVILGITLQDHWTSSRPRKTTTPSHDVGERLL